MPDLSNLLGAVYGDTSSDTDRDPADEAHVEREPAASDRAPAVPDWADDEHLDAAFAQWKPGPPADASPVERAFVKDTAFIKDTADDPAPPLADDLAAALSEALVAVSGTPSDTADTATDPRPAQRYDFSADVDEPDEDPSEAAEPLQAFAPVHAVEEPDEDDHLSKPEIAPDEHAETEQSRDFGEVSEVVAEPEPELEEAEPLQALAPEDADAEPEAAPEPDPVVDEHTNPEAVSPFAHATPVVEEAPAEEPRPTMTSQRAAAAELTAASRFDTEAVADTPSPTPERAPEPAPVPVAAVPAPIAPAPTPAPSPGDGAMAPSTLPAGTRRWERGDDDILPEKSAKKLFSFSLRRG